MPLCEPLRRVVLVLSCWKRMTVMALEPLAVAVLQQRASHSAWQWLAPLVVLLPVLPPPVVVLLPMPPAVVMVSF